MTQKDKDLLLKDLCARLPYGVKVESTFINPDTKEHKSCGIEVFDATNLLMIRDGLGEFKPYLFPLSSMTEEQKAEFDVRTFEIMFGEVICKKDDEMGYGKLMAFDLNFYNKYHLDWRGLIPLGLAIDATGKNIY